MGCSDLCTLDSHLVRKRAGECVNHCSRSVRGQLKPGEPNTLPSTVHQTWTTSLPATIKKLDISINFISIVQNFYVFLHIFNHIPYQLVPGIWMTSVQASTSEEVGTRSFTSGKPKAERFTEFLLTQINCHFQWRTKAEIVKPTNTILYLYLILHIWLWHETNFRSYLFAMTMCCPAVGCALLALPQQCQFHLPYQRHVEFHQ